MNAQAADRTVKGFWLRTAASVTITSLAVGVAVGLGIVDDDAALLVLGLVSVAFALIQLLNTGRVWSVFFRFSLFSALPFAGMGWGMLTTFLIQGDRGRVISREGPLGYVMVLAVALAIGIAAGLLGVVITFIKRKITGKSGALPKQLVFDVIYRRKAMLAALLAPVASLGYLLIRYLLLHGFEARPPDTMFSMIDRQHQLAKVLALLDIVFFAALFAGLIYLLVGIVAARRRILGAQQQSHGISTLEKQ